MATKTDLFMIHSYPNHRRWFSLALKRGFDIVVSALALVLISPILGFIALAIRHDSPGPVIYRGPRTGRGGKTFKIYKFRTMYENPQSYSGPQVTAHDDPRVTPFGHWLRDTKINELPQLLNVLKGDMSLVGPRPEDPTITQSWPRKVKEEVLSVRPGITSPASVQYHNEEALLSYGGVLQKYIQELGPDKMRLDQLYVRYRSFLLDMDVLLWTALIFVPKVGEKPLPEDLLFMGPFTRVTHRYLNWFIIDVLVTFVAMSLTVLTWRAFGPLNIGLLRTAGIIYLFAFLFSSTGAILGMNHISWSKATFADAYDLLPAWLTAAIMVFFVNWQMRFFPWTLVAASSGVAAIGFVLVRYRSRLLTTLLVWAARHVNVRQARERVLIVGSGRTAEHIAWLLNHPTYTSKFQVVGFVEDNLLARGTRIYGAKVIGACQDLPQLVKKHDVGLVLLADHSLDYKKYRSIIQVCDNLLTKVLYVPDIFGSLSSLAGTMDAEISTEFLKEEDDFGEPGFRCQRCLAKCNHAGSEDGIEENSEVMEE